MGRGAEGKLVGLSSSPLAYLRQLMRRTLSTEEKKTGMEVTQRFSARSPDAHVQGRAQSLELSCVCEPAHGRRHASCFVRISTASSSVSALSSVLALIRGRAGAGCLGGPATQWAPGEAGGSGMRRGLSALQVGTRCAGGDPVRSSCPQSAAPPQC